MGERFTDGAQYVRYGELYGHLWVMTPWVSMIVDTAALWLYSPCCREGLYEGPWDRLEDDGQAYCEKCDAPLGLELGEQRLLWAEDWQSEFMALLAYSLDPLAALLTSTPLIVALEQVRADFARAGDYCWATWTDGRRVTRLPEPKTNSLGQVIS